MTNVRNCVVLFLFTICSAQAQLQWFSEDEGRVQWANNCNFIGSAGTDLGKFSRKKREDCAALCFEKPPCTRFTWTVNVSGGTCRLKSGNEKAVFSEGEVCGSLTTDKFHQNGINWQYIAKTRWALNCYFTGPTLVTKNVIGALCGGECEKYEDCIGFAWTDYEGGMCWLKSRGHPIVAYTGRVGVSVCGEISGRKSSYGSARTLSNGSKRKSELACDEYKEVASHYRSTRNDPSKGMEFPWMVAVGYTSNKQIITFRCDGTIISDFHVLVAAHCVHVEPVPEIVRLGTHILNHGKYVDMDIESITKHEQFSLETSFEAHKNDIALIKLKLRITFSDRILPACLRVKTNDLHRNQKLFVTGWEITEEGKLSNVLKKTHLRTVDLRTCQATFLKNGSEPSNQINENQYCAADPDRLGDVCPCPGESGGPLQTFEKWQSLSTVVGIASFRKSSELPGVYIRVASFLHWIEENVWPD